MKHVSSRLPVYLGVVVAALCAAGVAVGITLDTRTTPQQPKAAPGKPPVPQGLTGPAAPVIVAAFANWPHGSIDTMQRLGLEYAGGSTPKEREQSAVVQFYRGIALDWAGYPSDAAGAWQLAKRLGRNTVIQSWSDSLLHPSFYRPNTGGPTYPIFVPTSKNPLLRRGSILQAQGHQLSAERLFQQAVKADPADVEARVAAAIGAFDEDNLVPVFGQLGPLVKSHPASQVAHYYFGLVLVWTAQAETAIKQFQATVRIDSRSPLGQQALKLLEAIAQGKSQAAAAK